VARSRCASHGIRVGSLDRIRGRIDRDRRLSHRTGPCDRFREPGRSTRGDPLALPGPGAKVPNAAHSSRAGALPIPGERRSAVPLARASRANTPEKPDPRADRRAECSPSRSGPWASRRRRQHHQPDVAADTTRRTGYYDEWFRTQFVSASRVHIDWLHQKLRSELGVRGWVGTRAIAHRQPIHQLAFGKHDSITLLTWLYADRDASCLLRKRLIWDDYGRRHPALIPFESR